MNVTVLDDDILEPTEELVAMLTEDDTRVEVDRDQAIVQIADNDGKHNGRNRPVCKMRILNQIVNYSCNCVGFLLSGENLNIC